MNSKKLKESQEIRDQILTLTKAYSKLVHNGINAPSISTVPTDRLIDEDIDFIPGITPINYAARVFDEEEVMAAVSSSLDFWLTLGEEGSAMERELANFLGIRKTLLVNSGSSANLVALSSLTSPKVPGQRLMKGDEVITCAAGFPTTVSPIIQNGLVPVFVDNNPLTGNLEVSQLEEAFNPKKTKAVMVAHTLGNPFDIGAVLSFCKKYDLWLIEDNCDALGSVYKMPTTLASSLGQSKSSSGLENEKDLVQRWTGTWGDLSTQSFYPPHHLTMGEGGAVNISGSLKLHRIAESFRDWGRDCWCPSGKDNTCGLRFEQTLGTLPCGFDHKYTYSHIGYNLKPLDIQAAIGRVQLQRLSSFIEKRKENWTYLRKGLSDLEKYMDFMLPTHAKAWNGNDFDWDESGCITDASWFGFMINVKDDAPFNRTQLAQYLTENKIGNRMLFGGNLLRQPAMVQLKADYPDSMRSIGDHSGADKLMNNAVFIGTYPGLNNLMLDYMIGKIFSFTRKF
ncbi:lipopolysaccharide biosynthesis protein RfbH [Alphaproteobacteria bacterium]|nr:lipopolysaccharide biosynthesis protein RfbH [Alphaproteobacteria bacterium]